jgi:hypothetical protein
MPARTLHAGAHATRVREGPAWCWSRIAMQFQRHRPARGPRVMKAHIAEVLTHTGDDAVILRRIARVPEGSHVLTRSLVGEAAGEVSASPPSGDTPAEHAPVPLRLA